MTLNWWPPTGRNRFRFGRGITMFEILTAVTVLGILLVACAQMLAVMTVQQQSLRNRRAALQMAQNAMERTFAFPRHRGGVDEKRDIAAEIMAQEMLRDAQVEITIDRAADLRDIEVVRVAVSWREGAEKTQRVERLTAWRYRSEESETPAAPPGGPQPKAAKP